MDESIQLRQLALDFNAIPPGLCQCGCGQVTYVPRRTDPVKGWVKGQPIRYRKGHNKRTDLATRFWSKVDRSGECWVYTGAPRNKYGHGAFSIGDKSYSAYQVAWLLLVGPLPQSKQLNHKCNNPPCCRIHPDHVYAGTQQENMDDKVRAQRQARGDTHGSRTRPDRVPRGERHAMTTLTDEQVRAIKREYQEKPFKVRTYARERGISRTVIRSIVKGITWGHIKV